jgi:2-methylisocitrate lyase-like PEP mutase family enzyme
MQQGQKCERKDHDRQGKPFPRTARGTGCVRDRQCLGRGFRTDSSERGVRRASHFERRGGRRARATRWTITREESLTHARAVVEATDLPVSADLEKGFGDAPEDAALTIRLAGEIGLVGGSIEDATLNPQKQLFDAGHAKERIAAAVEAARRLPFPFTLTARAENFIRGNPDLDDTIRRLLAFEAAGADVLMAPGLPDLAAVRTVCAALSKPFNFMAGIKGKSFSVAELAEVGVKRISLASSLYRAAMTGLLNAAREVHDKGTLSYIDTTMATPELNAFIA